MNIERPSYLYPTPGRVALVLAGGAARGAYEVGVVQHIAEEVARDLGRDPPIDIISGTSVGAINGCALAAFADAPRTRARRLIEQWTKLIIKDVVQLKPSSLWTFMRSALGGAPRESEVLAERYGGLLDATGLEKIIASSIPFARIREHLQNRLLTAVTVSATHIGSGTTVVFIDRSEPGLPRWSRDPKVRARRATLRINHALASAAIPLMFPSVRIDEEFYCDGGLRMNIPLSPARILGADGVLVVNPRYVHDVPPDSEDVRDKRLPGPWFMIGKALNALLLDRVENDIERLQRINRILRAGQTRWGEEFVPELNRAMHAKDPTRMMRPLSAILVHSTKNIGRLAAEYVRSPTFRRRNSGPVATTLRHLAEGERDDEADLLSYVLFDGEFAAQLIELGRRDARDRHQELVRFFTSLEEQG